MKPKIKIALTFPLWLRRIRRAKVVSRKIERYEDEQRYPHPWRNNYVLKKTKKLAKALNIKLSVEGFENLPKGPCVLAPNHSSAFDPGLIVMALENPGKSQNDLNHLSVFLAKESIKKNKKLSGFINMMNTFYIDRKNPRTALRTIDEMAEHAKEYQKHIVIFPEGTRSKTGVIGEFKGGAFKIAKKAYLPIIPVTINNALSITNLKRKGKLEVNVIFHPIIKQNKFISMETKYIAKNIEKIVKSRWTKPEGETPKLESSI